MKLLKTQEPTSPFNPSLSIEHSQGANEALVEHIQGGEERGGKEMGGDKMDTEDFLCYCLPGFEQ